MARPTREEITERIYEYGRADRAAREFNHAEMRRVNEQADSLEAARKAALERSASEFAQAEMRRLESQTEAAKKAAAAQVGAATKAAGGMVEAQQWAARLVVQGENDLTAKTRQAADDRLRAAVKAAAEVGLAATARQQGAAMAQWSDGQAVSKMRVKELAEHSARIVGGGKSIAEVDLGAVERSVAGAGLANGRGVWRRFTDEAAQAAEAASGFQRGSRLSAALVGRAVEERPIEAPEPVAGAGLGRAFGGVSFRSRSGNLAAGQPGGGITDELAKWLRTQAAMMQGRQSGGTGIPADLAGLISTLGKVDRERAGLGQVEAVRQALAELNRRGVAEEQGGGAALARSLQDVTGQVVGERGPAGGAIGLDERRSERTPDVGEAGRTRAVQSWLALASGKPPEHAQVGVGDKRDPDELAKLVAAAVADMRRAGDVERGKQLVGGELAAVASLGESVRSLRAVELPSFDRSKEWKAALAAALGAGDRGQVKVAEYLRTQARQADLSGGGSTVAPRAGPLDMVQGRTGVGHLLGPGPVQGAGALMSSGVTDLLDRMVRLQEQQNRIAERLLDVLQGQAGSARPPLGTAGADRSPVPPALPARPLEWNSRL